MREKAVCCNYSSYYLQFTYYQSTTIRIYCIYPKYWDILTPNHTFPKLKKKSILLPAVESKIVLDERQKV